MYIILIYNIDIAFSGWYRYCAVLFILAIVEVMVGIDFASAQFRVVAKSLVVLSLLTLLTYFTTSNLQILTEQCAQVAKSLVELSLLALLVQQYRYWHVRRSSGSLHDGGCSRGQHCRYWVYLLYWYKSTDPNTWGAAELIRRGYLAASAEPAAAAAAAAAALSVSEL